jgi:hypothetical protein
MGMMSDFRTGPDEVKTVQQQHEQGAQRHQAIFSIDMEDYQNLIRAYNVRTPLIPHRNDEEGTPVNAGAWYG